MTAAALCAVALAGAAGALLPRRPATDRLRTAAGTGAWRSGLAMRSAPRRSLSLAATLAGVAFAGHALGPGLAVAALVMSPTVLASVRRARHRASRRRVMRAVVEFADLVVAALHAGRMPPHAVRMAATADATLFAAVAAAGGAGADLRIVEALRLTSGVDGAGGLRAMAAAWEVALSSGAGLAAVLDGVSAMVRDELDVADQVAGELATVRTTARLLAVLPILPAVLGIGLGTDPVGILLRHPLGIACVILGGTLISLGLWWVERIAAGVERSA